MELRSGDILFQDIGCGAVCDAINGSTPGWNGAEINHCGIVLEDNDFWFVVEAISPSVRLTHLSDFYSRSTDVESRPRIIQSRLKHEFDPLIPAALEFAKAMIGVPYDGRFGADRSALYCSELIVDAFWFANEKEEVFQENPMSFSDPETGQILEFWIDYYAFFGEVVPEGELGSNPGDLSLSPKFDAHHQLGSLRGLEL